MPPEIAVVVGTRPEAIKLAPVADALSDRGLAPTLIFTGQHPQLDPSDYGLDLYPAMARSIPGQDDPHAHVGLVSKAVADAIAPHRPDLLIVQGDTSSALGGALAATVAGVPLAHVEAGLRSHDPRRPWPEEEFRVAIDGHSDLLFAPTELSAANLRRERVRGRIYVTGNSGIDAVLRAQNGMQVCAGRRRLPHLLVTCHRRENWGLGLAGVAAALRAIAAQAVAKVEVVLHPNPSLAERVSTLVCGIDGLTVRPPGGHSATLAAMLRADLVLSDSGGMQEEAAALGVPLLVLREKTERPEAIACGNVELVGTDPARIVSAVRRQLNGTPATRPALPFGDGRAGERIARIVEEWLEEKPTEQLSPKSSAVPRTAGYW